MANSFARAIHLLAFLHSKCSDPSSLLIFGSSHIERSPYSIVLQLQAACSLVATNNKIFICHFHKFFSAQFRINYVQIVSEDVRTVSSLIALVACYQMYSEQFGTEYISLYIDLLRKLMSGFARVPNIC